MTLRQLVWMSRARMRVEGELAAYQIAWIAKLTLGKQLDVNEINPYREQAAKSKELERIEAWQARMRWRAMVANGKAK